MTTTQRPPVRARRNLPAHTPGSIMPLLIGYAFVIAVAAIVGALLALR